MSSFIEISDVLQIEEKTCEELRVRLREFGLKLPEGLGAFHGLYGILFALIDRIDHLESEVDELLHDERD